MPSHNSTPLSIRTAPDRAPVRLLGFGDPSRADRRRPGRTVPDRGGDASLPRVYRRRAAGTLPGGNVPLVFPETRADRRARHLAESRAARKGGAA